MSEMSEYWKDVKPYYKEKHDKRVAKTPDRIEYSKKEFMKNGIYAELKNIQTGQFNIRKGQNIIVYYCSTGKVLLNNKPKEARGIKYVIGLFKNLEVENTK